MRKFIAVLLTAALLCLTPGVLPQAQASTEVSVSLEFFHSNLGAYGHWHHSESYGEVWMPGVAYAGWNPYYEGHWVYTDEGWFWDSDYEWGDLCYHYGTWVYESGYGWVWVPGYTWAPSWVIFRDGPDYVGFAPCQ